MKFQELVQRIENLGLNKEKTLNDLRILYLYSGGYGGREKELKEKVDLEVYKKLGWLTSQTIYATAGEYLIKLKPEIWEAIDEMVWNELQENEELQNKIKSFPKKLLKVIAFGTISENDYLMWWVREKVDNPIDEIVWAFDGTITSKIFETFGEKLRYYWKQFGVEVVNKILEEYGSKLKNEKVFIRAFAYGMIKSGVLDDELKRFFELVEKYQFGVLSCRVRRNRAGELIYEHYYLGCPALATFIYELTKDTKLEHELNIYLKILSMTLVSPLNITRKEIQNKLKIIGINEKYLASIFEKLHKDGITSKYDLKAGDNEKPVVILKEDEYNKGIKEMLERLKSRFMQ